MSNLALMSPTEKKGQEKESTKKSTDKRKYKRFKLNRSRASGRVADANGDGQDSSASAVSSEGHDDTARGSGEPAVEDDKVCTFGVGSSWFGRERRKWTNWLFLFNLYSSNVASDTYWGLYCRCRLYLTMRGGLLTVPYGADCSLPYLLLAVRCGTGVEWRRVQY